MTRNSIRKSLVLKNPEQYTRWQEYMKMKGYGNFSQMIRCIIEAVIKRESEPFEKIIEPLKDSLDGLYKIIDINTENLEIIRMRLAEKEGNSEIIKAAKEILPFILQRESSSSEINGKFSHYSQDIIDGAVALLIDLGLLGTRRNSITQDKSGGI